MSAAKSELGSKKKVYHPTLDLISITDKETINHYQQMFSMSVLSIEALDIIKLYSPIIEIGGGSGYDAFLLNVLGTDIISFDKNLYEIRQYFYPVQEGTCSKIEEKGKNRNLMLIWPAKEVIFTAVKNFVESSDAKYFIYIMTQERRDCIIEDCDCKEFTEYLDAHFNKIKSLDIPHWKDGNRNALTIYEKL